MGMFTNPCQKARKLAFHGVFMLSEGVFEGVNWYS